MSAEQPTFLRLAEELNQNARETELQDGISFDDVKILPGRSRVQGIDEVDISQTLAPGIRLETPIISANMDTVTEKEMAIAMALQGGIGAIHRALTIDEGAAMVERVKNEHQYIIDEPPVLTPADTVGRARELMEQHDRGYVVVLDAANKLHGIVTTRDLHRTLQNDTTLTNEIITSNEKGLVVAPPDISMNAAQELMWHNRVEKLIIVDNEGNLGGVITDRDIREIQRYPKATKGKDGRLQVLGSIGIGSDAVSRAEALVGAGADGIVIDVLHGDCDKVINLIDILSGKISVPVIAGNVGTDKEAIDLFNAGAHVVKVGYGDGSFCTTQIVTGSGASQFKLIVTAAAAAAQYQDSTIIADGGIRFGGDFAKAMAGGAAAIMIGGLFVGTDESPGELLRSPDGRLYKLGRGSASNSASKDFARASGATHKRRAPQGIDVTQISYRGSVEEILFELSDGLKHAVANTGGNNIDSFQRVVQFERQSPGSLEEGRPRAQRGF